MARPRSLPFLIAALTLLSGCASVRDPAIEVISANLRDTSAEAIAFELVLDLSNPNDEPLHLLEVDYKVQAEGADFSGRRAIRSTLGPQGRMNVVVPAVVRLDELAAGRAVESATIRGTVRYAKPGRFEEVLFDAGLQRPKAGFRGEAAIARPQASR